MYSESKPTKLYRLTTMDPKVMKTFRCPKPAAVGDGAAVVVVVVEGEARAAEGEAR